MILFGIKAKIFLRHDLGIEELSKSISSNLNIPNFYFDSDMDPPHEITGHCEALGFEIWLNKSDEIDEYPF